uniref:Uncharacterized protein n=1 Tax=Caenorhabditis japonica TaxID=281687 RepID=A0A8R1I1X8_CAEJA
MVRKYCELPTERSDIYHKITEDLAYPASARCRNHENVGRILALYLDCIRAVNAEEFANFRLMNSALAVMHDFTRYIHVDGLTNDTVALAVVYFLVDYYKIKVKLRAADTPWFSILNRSEKLEDLESIWILIENELISRHSLNTDRLQITV